MADVAVIAMEIVGEPLTGEWCPRCLLPSGVEALLAMTWASGRRSGQAAGSLVYRRCVDCGEPL